jgi:transglutaminase-like putative cysteine protease
MGINGIDPYIVNLLPPTPSKPANIIDTLPKPKPGSINSILFDKIRIFKNLNEILMQFKGWEKPSELDHHKYVQITPQVQTLAWEITRGLSSNDEKMYAIEQWVQHNISYVSDAKNYGSPEYWAYPVETLKKASGDCEDGAFLIHSLALASGVPAKRLRTYGGLVANPLTGAPVGHGWTTYQRETDNEWVTLDWCYWAKHSPLTERKLMSEDLNYYDDFWYIQENKTVETPYYNKVRFANSYNTASKGLIVNTYV